MKLILHSLALLLILAYLAEIKISFSPFSITFTRGWLVIGMILITCGCICLKAQWYSDGVKEYREQYKEGLRKEIEEQIKEKI